LFAVCGRFWGRLGHQPAHVAQTNGRPRRDPATGSAAGPLVSRLVAQGVVPDGAPVLVEQGHAMGRPSRIRVQVSGERVRIGGAGVVVAEGTLTI
jgi:predicted PhzF superfamily epimerase YddE/YHI9